MKFSIITPMYNSEKYIGRMIQALKNLDYEQEKIEIIVIDNGSKDDSVSIVQGMGVTCSTMKGASISEMRNAGASMATGTILGFVDSDCIVSENWAKLAVNFIADDVGIVGGYYGLGDAPGWIERTWHNLKKDITGDVSFVSAGNMLIKAERFKEVGGFDEKLETGEDWDFCQRVLRAGYRVVNQPSLYVTHLGNHKTFVGIIKKERWYGQGMFDVLKGRLVTKPLLISILFLILSLISIFSLLMNSLDVAIYSLVILFSLIALVSYHFTRYVKKERLLTFVKCIPISFCYVLGRSLSVVDVVIKKVIS